MTDKRIYQIGLTMINGVGDILARHLLEALGDAEAVFTEKRQSLEKDPGYRQHSIARRDQAGGCALQRAEKELAFAEKERYLLSIILTDTRLSGALCGNARTPRYSISISRGTLDLDRRPVSSALWVLAGRPLMGRELTEALIAGLGRE